jgi:uncharacterized protein YkwD
LEVHVNRKALIPVGVVMVAAVIAIGVVAVKSGEPTFVAVGGGVDLGKAQKHAAARTDPLVQLANGALSAAAGNAGSQLALVSDAQPTDGEVALLALTNQARASNGLSPVTFDQTMLRVARARAAAQIPDGALSHYNSLGDLAFVGLLAEAGVTYTLAGENLARAAPADTSAVANLNDALLNSPTHRANILEPTFNRLAIGEAGPSIQRVAFAEIFRNAPDEASATPAQ